MDAVAAMVQQITATQRIQLVVLQQMSPSAARDQAIKQAEAQIKAVQAVLPKLLTLFKDRKMTRAELDALTVQLPQILTLMLNSQGAITDAIDTKIPDLKPPPIKTRP